MVAAKPQWSPGYGRVPSFAQILPAVLKMPLVRTFVVSSKKGRKAWANPVLDPASRSLSFEIGVNAGTPPEPTVGRNGARCVACGNTVPLEYVRSESRTRGLEPKLMAIVAEGNRERIYVAPTEEHEIIASSAIPTWTPDGEIADNPGHTNVFRYGLTTFADLFTPRQLTALSTFCNLIGEVRAEILAAGGSEEYATAVATYLSFALSKMADRGSTICTWFTDRDSTRNTFARQAIPMTWDFAELNTLLNGTGSFAGAVEWTAESLDGVPLKPCGSGSASQLDATVLDVGLSRFVFSTDPPYYDNIGYADLSDFFYVWLRRSLSGLYPDLFSTLLVPKTQELVATAYRFGGNRQQAQEFFEDGFGRAFVQMRESQQSDYPLTVYYAFKQAESSDDGDSGDVGHASTGWETMLEGLLRSDSR